MKEYTYYLTRDNGDKLPRAGMIEFESYINKGYNNPLCHEFGRVVYDHQLTDKEQFNYVLFADENNYTMLYDEFPQSIQDYDDENDNAVVIIDGVQYPVEICLSNLIPDSVCERVNVDGVYYYFG